ncbi:HepT-like ribonuclease domain-containing protein [Methylocaldum sp. MU1018]
MSDAMPREWRFYLDDMIGFVEKVLAYTRGLDQAAFEASGLNYDATLRNLELIGEAATHIPESVRQAHPEIPWRMIVATRNRLIHGYLGIDNDTVWSIVRDDVPNLLQQLKLMREKSA